jgi:hypothetical protein
MKRYIRLLTAVVATVWLGFSLHSCSEEGDCSIAGRAMINCILYTVNPETGITQLDTLPSLTVTALGTDSIIVNRDKDVHIVSLPLSYVSDSTVLVFHYDYDNDPTICDTVLIRQTNTPYFESLECGYSVTQTVDDIKYTKQQLDSIYILNVNTNTNGTENLKLFYRYTY